MRAMDVRTPEELETFSVLYCKAENSISFGELPEQFSVLPEAVQAAWTAVGVDMVKQNASMKTDVMNLTAETSELLCVNLSSVANNPDPIPNLELKKAHLTALF